MTYSQLNRTLASTKRSGIGGAVNCRGVSSSDKDS